MAENEVELKIARLMPEGVSLTEFGLQVFRNQLAIMYILGGNSVSERADTVALMIRMQESEEASKKRRQLQDGDKVVVAEYPEGKADQ